MKNKLLFSAAFMAILLWGATTGNIQWTQIRSTDRHGTDSKGQSSDGTGTSGNLAKYNLGGGLTNGPALPLSVVNGGSGTSTPSLVPGTNITISGSWPNQTVAASGGGGGLTLLNTLTASNSATLVDTTSITATYDTYQFKLVNIIPVTSGASLLLRMSTDGGSTYDSGANYNWAQFEWIVGATATQGGGDTSITLLRTMKTTSGWSGNGFYELYNPGSASLFKSVVGQYSTLDNGNAVLNGYSNVGNYAVTTAVNAIQFLMSSGNISSGIIRIYGVAK